MDEWEVIDTYSRKDALADGVQVEIPENIRKEAGVKYPVFVTEQVWKKYLEPPQEFPEQDLEGRIWDLLTILKMKARNTKGNVMEMTVLFRMPEKGDWEINEYFDRKTGREMRYVRLKAIAGPLDFDDRSPAITIMKPNED